MSELTTQLNAILTAPIPFFIAFIVVAGFTLTAAWRAFEWRYRAEIEKTKSNFELSRSEIQILAQIGARKEADLNETLSKQTEQIEGLKKQLDARANLPPEKSQSREEWESIKKLIVKLLDTTSAAKHQAGELGKANNAIAEANQYWLDRRTISVKFRNKQEGE